MTKLPLSISETEVSELISVSVGKKWFSQGMFELLSLLGFSFGQVQIITNLDTTSVVTICK